MSSHTPGPWAVSLTCSRGTPASVIAPKNENGFTPWVCHMQAANIDTGNANARLIAAAPELLEALSALVINCDAGSATVGALTDARAAIAKATGGAA